ncbi:MAG: hypothetical protein KOO60_00900 [Gemmatimonadales bacterium]|nr:hypothetical protein [Gemmatimonadales bacterium]
MNPPLNSRTPLATTLQKALEFNLNPLLYGSIVEIGAGQEVARNFFQAGGASGTIAQSSSAYDMRFSDAIYGPDDTGRYVTRKRLIRMLDREYELVIERVSEDRPAESLYFAFADTVSAKRFGVDSECHGWMGIRFQHEPGAPPSQIILHVLMLDSSNTGQQNVLGTLGVNLIHSTFKHLDDCRELVDSLNENLTWGRIEIDYLHFEGPCFNEEINRKMPLQLVSSSLGPVAMIDKRGQCALPADMMYKKIPLILRGTFRPFTNVHIDMIETGLKNLTAELKVDPDQVVLFCEMNIARHLYEGGDDLSDLQARVEMINDLGYNAMVTSHLRFFRLGEYFQKHSLRRIGFLLSVADLDSIFDNQYYEGLPGGILQAMAKLFSSDSKLLAYPNLTPGGEVRTVENLEISEDLRHLYDHLVFNRRILKLDPPRGRLVPFDPDALGGMISADDNKWMDAVPPLVRDRIGELKI